jgi:outer membrane scaffolding protein for murein synthesis (MipA/OmpV family)
VSDEHEGYVVYLTGGYDLVSNDTFMLNLGAHVTYADTDYMDTYFSVDNNTRGNSTLPNFNASDGIKDAGLSLNGIYHFNKTWALAGNLSWTRMLNDAEDSPLVDGNGGVGDENQFGGVVAAVYSF